MGRHQADDVAPGLLRGWYDGQPVSRPTAACWRCGSSLLAGYGAQVGCGHCGATWQADVAPPTPARPQQPGTGPRLHAARRAADDWLEDWTTEAPGGTRRQR
jgi:ribosomal protein S27AE